MRLPSAFVVLTVAALATGCAIPVAPSPQPGPVLASLKDLGVDGRTYVVDLGADRSFRVDQVFAAGDDLLIQDIHGGLDYVDGRTLNVRWAYFGLPRTFDAPPDVTDSMVVGVSQSKVYVLSRDAGSEVIEPRTVPVVPSAGLVANETTAYVPTYRTAAGNKTVVAVNLADGYMGWGIRTDSDVKIDLAKAGLHGGDMFYVASGNALQGIPTYVASKRDPEPAWTINLGAAVHEGIAVSGEDLAVATDDNRLVCLDRITGGIRWVVYPDSGELRGSAAQFSPKLVFYVCGGELRAFDRATGAKAWAVAGPNQFVAQRGERTIVTDGLGMLWAIDTKSGKVVGSKSLPGWRFPVRPAADATVVGISNSGMIVAVELGW